jgi:hypothetical protein
MDFIHAVNRKISGADVTAPDDLGDLSERMGLRELHKFNLKKLKIENEMGESLDVDTTLYAFSNFQITSLPNYSFTLSI